MVDAIWSTSLIVFDKKIGNAQNIVLSQGREALRSLNRRIDLLYNSLNKYPKIKGIYPDPEIPQILSELCFHQGLASKILFDDREKGLQENPHCYKLRIERAEYVRRYTSGSAFPLLSNRKMRNALVHVDEYLDKALKASNTGWMIDSALAFRDELRPVDNIKIGFCRSYIASEDVLVHLGQELSVSALRLESIEVLARVFGVPTPLPLSNPPQTARGLK